jgi:prophage regulatory protein
VETLLRLPTVLERTGLSRSGLYQKIAAKEFPRPVPLGDGARAKAWVASEIESWINNRIARRDTDRR